MAKVGEYAMYSVYVIELDEEVLKSQKFKKKNPDYIEGMACLYVGHTSLEPEERFKQHKSGAKSKKGKNISNNFAFKHGRCLRKRLYKKYNPITTKEVAMLVEEYLANKLKKKGFGVWWN